MKRSKKKLISLATCAVLSSSIVASLFSNKDFLLKIGYGIKSENIIDNFDDFNTGAKIVTISHNLYTSALIDSHTSIPFIGNMVPQGITLYNDYYLISYYDYEHKNNSLIVTIDRDGNFINSAELPNNAHVGGICYDSANDLIWISAKNGNINIYNAMDVITSDKLKPCFDEIDVGDGLINFCNPFTNSVSYLTIYKGHLFVGSFSISGDGLVKKYLINNDQSGNISLDFINSFSVPSKVQGITFYEKDNNEYMFLSRSYTPYLESVIQIFIYNEEIERYDSDIPNICYTLPEMIEQITVSNNNLYAIFESSAKEFRNKVDSDIRNILVFDTNSLILKKK